MLFFLWLTLLQWKQSRTAQILRALDKEVVASNLLRCLVIFRAAKKSEDFDGSQTAIMRCVIIIFK
jgi:hypothetical protein